jgi:hypothetical protein
MTTLLKIVSNDTGGFNINTKVKNDTELSLVLIALIGKAESILMLLSDEDRRYAINEGIRLARETHCRDINDKKFGKSDLDVICRRNRIRKRKEQS